MSIAMPTSMKKIAILIPCHNEEESIGNVIRSFPRERMRRYGYTLDIIVIANNCKDRTADVATSLGARVLMGSKKGKGNAMRQAFHHIPQDAEYVVMLDGDHTYPAEEIMHLIAPLESSFCNVVIGSRLGGNISKGSMKPFNRFGNWMYSHLVRYCYRVNVTDVLTGYYAWKREVIERLRPHLTSEGFTIEMEMVTKMAKMGERIYCVPISYNVRGGRTNLHPIRDGAKILMVFARNLFWRPIRQSAGQMVGQPVGQLIQQ